MPGSCFKSIYLLPYNVWVSLGQFVILSVLGAGGAPRIAQVLTFQRSGSAGALITIRRLRRCPLQSMLGRWTHTWDRVQGAAGVEVIDTNFALYDIDIYPMQPDFTDERVDGRVMSCVNMHIM